MAAARLLCWIAGSAMLAAPCAASPPGSLGNAAQFPAAIRGCWEHIGQRQLDDEEVEPFDEILIITANQVVTQSAGVGRRTGTIRQVNRISPTGIDGLIAGREGGNTLTLATSLDVGSEHAPPGMLLLREGDAGSYLFERCRAETAAAQRYSLVIARSGNQLDPVPAPCGRDGTCGDSLFLTRFEIVEIIAGGSIPASFGARMKLHSPLIGPTTLAVIVEREDDGRMRVLRKAGFNGRTGIACFDEPDEWPVDWAPDVPAVHRNADVLCLTDPAHINPNRPR